MTNFIKVSKNHKWLKIVKISTFWLPQVAALHTTKTLFSTQPINLVVEEISRNKSSAQTPITDFIYEKEKHVSIQHNSKLTLTISGTPFSWH